MFKKIQAGFALYLSLCGFFGFSLFIIEESLQTVMFSTWQSASCQDWRTVKQANDLMTRFCRTMRVVNYIGGWINPLTYISYSAYAEATDQYVKASNGKVFAHAPHLFVGEEVSFELTPKSWEATEGGWTCMVGTVRVLSRSPLQAPAAVSGVLQPGLVVDVR